MRYDPDLYGPPEHDNEPPEADQLLRVCCPRCDCDRFVIWYDPKAQGSHVECEECGEVVSLG